MQEITVGNVTYHPYVSPKSLRDLAVWRYLPSDVPPMFASLIEHTATVNSAQTNVNERVKVTLPLAIQDADTKLWSSKNALVCDMKFTSLQNIIGEVEKNLVLDAAIAALTSLKTAIVNGTTGN